MSTFIEIFFASLRLALLRILEEAPAYSANDSILEKMAQAMAMHCNRDQVHATLDWLAEQGLINQETLANRVRVATLTPRGLDVARGRAVVTGVDRPAPKA